MDVTDQERQELYEQAMEGRYQFLKRQFNAETDEEAETP